MCQGTGRVGDGFRIPALSPQPGPTRGCAYPVVFQGAIAWLSPRHLGDAPFLPAIEEYRRILNDASGSDRTYSKHCWPSRSFSKDWAKRPRRESKKDWSVARRRLVGCDRILLQQEEAHHGFGRCMLERAMAERTDRRGDIVPSRARLSRTDRSDGPDIERSLRIDRRRSDGLGAGCTEFSASVVDRAVADRR